MSPPAKKKSPLPSDIVGEILSRLPKKSLARFRSICKRWNNASWQDKCFLNKYLSHTQPQFILRTNSQIHTLAINDEYDDVSIEVRDITKTSEIRCQRHTSLLHCDGILLSNLRKKKGFALWNPWLRHKRLVVLEKKKNQHEFFRFCGVGYDNNSSYKIFGYDLMTQKVALFDCKSHEWTFIDAAPEEDWRIPKLDSMVSLNGNLYWIAYDSKKTHEYFIRSFDFSKEIFKTFCNLPNNEGFFGYTQVLAVFKGDRFSVLRQSYMTNKIEIFVTKENIGNGKDVLWISFMTTSISEIPRLQPKCLSSQPSYFLDDVDKKKKRLIVCTCDENGHSCIYIVKEDEFKKILIDYLVDDLWPSHLTYVPSLFFPILREEETSHAKKDLTTLENREKFALQNRFSVLDEEEEHRHQEETSP